jgi:hypothetical protein
MVLNQVLASKKNQQELTHFDATVSLNFWWNNLGTSYKHCHEN